MKLLIQNINKYKNNLNNIKSYKKQKIAKIIYEEDRKRSIIGENLLIYGLKKFFNINYSDISIKTNENLKPYILNRNIFYNISHSFDYVTCVFSNKTIGIDIEKIRNVDINVINIFATEKEKKYILSTKNNIYNRLFQIYTLKEAYFKMKGSSLNNLKTVEFIFCDHKIYCSDSKVKILSWFTKNGYVISICEIIK